MTLVFRNRRMFSQINAHRYISKLKWDATKPVKIISTFSEPFEYDYVKDTQIIFESMDAISETGDLINSIESFNTHTERVVLYINTLLKNNNKLYFIKEDDTMTMEDYPLKFTNVEVMETDADRLNEINKQKFLNILRRREILSKMLDRAIYIGLAASMTFLILKAIQ